MDKSQKLKLIKDSIGTYSNFPKEGITFRDVFGIFKCPLALKALKDLLLEQVAFLEFDIVVGLDSRGFLLGPLISLELSKPFIPIRKKGKLPGKVLQQSYSLEYGEDVIEIQADCLQGKTRALIVDDLIATGGTMVAAVKLLKSAGIKAVECLTVIEITSLKGSSFIDSPVHSLIKYP